MKRFILILGILAVVLFGVTVPTFLWWRSYAHSRREEKSYETAKAIVEHGNVVDAVSIIRAYRAKSKEDPDNAEKWLHVEIEACETMKHVPRLVWMLDNHEEDLLQYEEASLLVARAALETDDIERFQQIRDHWKDRQEMKSAWFFLDVDALLKQREVDEAMALLKSRSFEGNDDCGRLARLAILTVPSDTEKAWDYLAEAYTRNPRNSDVRMFRGQFLEVVNRPEEARIEYVAAHLAAPENPFYVDKLADFYRRTGRIDLALQTWTQRLEHPSVDLIWMKTYFWRSVANRVPLKVDHLDPPDGSLKPLVAFLRELPDDQFWDADQFQLVSGQERYVERRQDVFWLHLLQLLKDGSEDEALSMLISNRFRSGSWHPELESRLAQVIKFRQAGSLRPPIPADPSRMAPTRHQLFELLDKVGFGNPDLVKSGLPPAVKRLLQSDHAFSAVLLAAGWREAALKLQGSGKITADMPDWYAYGMAQAIRLNRDDETALHYARLQPPSDVLSLLIGELQLAEGQSQAAVKQLLPLCRREDAIGYRATWLSVGAMLDAKDTASARKIAESNRTFAKSLEGQEIIASTWVADDDLDKAATIYGRLGDQSTAGLTFQARQAYSKKDWDEARRITNVLIERYPDEMQLHANLSAITDAESNQ